MKYGYCVILITSQASMPHTQTHSKQCAILLLADYCTMFVSTERPAEHTASTFKVKISNGNVGKVNTINMYLK